MKRTPRVEFTFNDPNGYELRCSMLIPTIPLQRTIDKVINNREMSIQEQQMEIFSILKGKLYDLDGTKLEDKDLTVYDKVYATQELNAF